MMRTLDCITSIEVGLLIVWGGIIIIGPIQAHRATFRPVINNWIIQRIFYEITGGYRVDRARHITLAKIFDISRKGRIEHHGEPDTGHNTQYIERRQNDLAGKQQALMPLSSSFSSLACNHRNDWDVRLGSMSLGLGPTNPTSWRSG